MKGQLYVFSESQPCTDLSQCRQKEPGLQDIGHEESIPNISPHIVCSLNLTFPSEFSLAKTRDLALCVLSPVCVNCAPS